MYLLLESPYVYMFHNPFMWKFVILHLLMYVVESLLSLI